MGNPTTANDHDSLIKVNEKIIKADGSGSLTINPTETVEGTDVENGNKFDLELEDEIYNRFSQSRKRAIVAIVSFAALLAPFASSSFLPSIPQMSRDLKGTGASSVLAVGAGSIGDIYKPTERGRAMGLFYAGAVLGPAISPVIAGIVTHRGIDKARKALNENNPTGANNNKFIWVWINPLQPLDLLKRRSVLTIGPRFGITNEAILGTFYLAPGAGNIVGSRLSGYVSDATIKRWIAKRAHFVPEDRLRATLISGGILVPCSLIGLGFTIQFWTTTGGLALSLVLLFISGVGFLGVFAVCNTYLVDSVQNRSAEVIATNNCLRYIASAGASAVVLPLIQIIGVAATNGIAATFTLIGFFLILLTIKYGEAWRKAELQAK
ncbi:hypothetical protein Clacol_003073 [Clathrus columnatus]|uniref:Major facilitator superfamily (MFS) profile domain-containing protein n=1 Tax=Clathrus columnatus TaxID=1419009 RepID=A0AAV5A5V3_9AGAM|nr:hypothetical protein Clacol_003073 [Clathrus columnatus]